MIDKENIKDAKSSKMSFAAIETLPEDEVISSLKKNEVNKISEEETREIVNQILEGKTELFDKIVEMYKTQIFHMAWKMTNHYEDSMDITQMVFIRVYQALNSWKGKSKFTTWLYRVVMNTSIDYFRRYSKHDKNRVQEYEFAGDEQKKSYEKMLEGVSYDDPRRHYEILELRKKIYDAVVKLKGKQKRCFVLRHYHDMALKEIAEILSCSEGTVKRHLHRANFNLRKLLS